jgi:hypothetical protein
MTVGLEITNPSGSLIAHADGVGTKCLGRASGANLVQPTYNNNGYSVYTFNSSEVCAFVVDMPIGYNVGIIGVSYNGATYTITAYCGSGDDGNGFQVQSWLTVWVIAETSATNTADSHFGLVLYRPNGSVAFDFTAPGISFVSAMGDYASGSIGIPALSRPVLLGTCEGYAVTYQYDFEQYPPYTKIDETRFAKRPSANVVDSDLVQIFKSNPQLSGGTNSNVVPSGRFVIFEGASFP